MVFSEMNYVLTPFPVYRWYLYANYHQTAFVVDLGRQVETAVRGPP
jgi:hypothetical protein